nr:hypothetical protein [Gammaproteobacteria bacterium]
PPPSEEQTQEAVAEVSMTEAADPFGTETPTEQKELAFGVLLSHTQTWKQKGLALGNLLKSICLAPGEVTRVAIVDWKRRTAGTMAEDTTTGEEVTSDIDISRAVNEVQKSVAAEAQQGAGTDIGMSTSTQVGYGGGSPFTSLSASAGSTTTMGLTASFSTGKRDLSAQAQNALNQRTAERSQSLRSRRASVVREVTEAESETMNARILANYNRRHALNIEYFEVLQTYSLNTKLTDWHRCIFIPLKTIDFSKPENIKTHRTKLYQIFLDLERKDLVKHLLQGENGRSEEIRGRLKTLESEIDSLRRKSSDVSAIAQRVVNDLNSKHYLFTSRIISETFSKIDEFNSRYQIDEFPGESQTNYEVRLQEAHEFFQQIREETRNDLHSKEVEEAALRERLLQAVLPLEERLADDSLFLSQQVWMRMDPFRVYQMLQKIKLGGKALSAMVDPHPVGVFGNYVAFRWGFRDDSGNNGSEVWQMDRKTFEKKFVAPEDNGASENSTTVAVPSDGIFAEAVLGRSEAAEEIDDTKFWKWEEHHIPILPPEIKELESRDRSGSMELTTAALDPSLAALRSQTPADISHIAQAITALQNGGMFRNMSGLAELTQQSAALAGHSSAGAKHAAEQAQKIHAKMVELTEHLVDKGIELAQSEAGQAIIAEAILPGSGIAKTFVENIGKGTKSGRK